MPMFRVAPRGDLPPELKNVKPTLGPLAGYGDKIAVVIGMVAFGVLCAVLVQGFIGIKKMSIGTKTHNDGQAAEGRAELVGALVKAVLVVIFGSLMSLIMVWAS